MTDFEAIYIVMLMYLIVMVLVAIDGFRKG